MVCPKFADLHNMVAFLAKPTESDRSIPPKTIKQKLARKNELKSKSTLLLAIPDEHYCVSWKINGCKDLLGEIKIGLEATRIKGVMIAEIKGQLSSSSSSQNVAFISSENTSITNEAVNTAHESKLGYIGSLEADWIMMDLESWDLKMASGHAYHEDHFAKECRAPRNQGNINRDASKRIVPVETPANALVVQDGIGGYDWSFQAEEDIRNFAQMAYTSQGSSSSDSEVNNVTTVGPEVVVSTAEGKRENVLKSSACWIWRPTGKVIDHISKDSGSYMPKRFNYVDPQGRLNGCSRHMTGNKSFLTDYQEVDGRFVAFIGSPKGGKITRKGKIRTGKLDFEDVYFVKELKFNIFSILQMCDIKNSVLFIKTECLVLSPDFKLLDESQVLLKVPRQNNMYNFDLKNVVPSGGLTCLFAKATIDESNLWHRSEPVYLKF
ncbi:hypothetical protein Tco_0619782 [Tanacetum coccineum]